MDTADGAEEPPVALAAAAGGSKESVDAAEGLSLVEARDNSKDDAPAGHKGGMYDPKTHGILKLETLPDDRVRVRRLEGRGCCSRTQGLREWESWDRRSLWKRPA